MRGVGARTAFAGYEDVDAVGRSGEGLDDAPLLPWTEPEYLKKLTFTQFVIYLVGFSEGLTHLAALAIYYLLKDDLVEIALNRPFFAFLSDSFAIFGYRRKPYMIFFSALEAVGFLMLGLSPASLSAAFCSAVAEALVVESTTGKTLDQSAENVSDFITAKAVGIFVATATFPLFITLISFFMSDVTTPPARNMKAQFRELSAFLKQSVIWGPAMYIFVYMAGPDYDDALFFFFTNKLGFSPTFMGTLRFTYGIAALLGVLLYRFVFRQAGFRQTLFWTIIVAVPIYISPVILVTGFNQKLGISNQAFVLSGGFLIEATAEIQLLPLLVLTASICPPGLEGSVYGMMMSIRNSGSMVSRGLSALFTWAVGITATNFSHLTSYILLCGAWLLLPLLFLGFM
ncbi:T1G11.18 protein, related [Neospora caninum Liverpool]|uniref:T1G11.18 protein, related n=1 Tax=Neospora caninum (strain Liverpool) TaxID=572307 RepID=F0VI20_NEOCL|nr:T1G11.18 protein, related [Neospora caninum Liverpool]CBZ53381.1 T1G11.18 protein, related [Neospora caninum Liverpool]|eukprot:XP_003883413.1 T1G11.18 protein, related [Neospora caninum Liverpool]